MGNLLSICEWDGAPNFSIFYSFFFTFSFSLSLSLSLPSPFRLSEPRFLTCSLSSLGLLSISPVKWDGLVAWRAGYRVDGNAAPLLLLLPRFPIDLFWQMMGYAVDCSCSGDDFVSETFHLFGLFFCRSMIETRVSLRIFCDFGLLYVWGMVYGDPGLDVGQYHVGAFKR
ncbi:hypothetical protein F5B17DRAFT_390769 [Nemania serpens]|nr:hypothetical protein F5B17DRAFT_390769 [Nemania serpens]